MILLSVVNLVRQFDREPVLDGITCEIQTGERIGLVGPNGAGKTTLMRLIAGLDQPDAGQVSRASSATVSLLAQHPEFAPGRTLIDEAREGLGEVFQLQREAAELAEKIAQSRDAQEQARLAKRYDAVQHELQHRSGFHVDHRIDQVLHGLGFVHEQYSQAMTSLSGGQQNRVALAQLLLRAPDLLLLDEPTNHLDIAATEWLEQFLLDSQRAMLIVSHDRYFLDRVCTQVWELHRGKLTEYPGNFSQYWRQRAERQLVADRAYEKQQEFIAKTEDYIRRNKYGQNATRAKDREHKLARVEEVERVSTITGPPMGFAPPTRTGDWVVDADNLSKGFGKPLFEHVSLRIQRGERWGILGPNGVGKTTLLRTLLGELSPDAGTTRFGANVQLGYFDQQLSGADPQLTAIEAIRPPNVARFTDGQLRDLLARFGVTGELALQRVGAMSGGERSKVALARLAALEPNVLVLDEPTNHLDLWSRDALEAALRDFAGTVVFVSHDRYFLDRVATHLFVLDAGSWTAFPGNYSDYAAFRKAREEEERAAAADRSANKSPPPPRSPGKKSRRKRKFPYRKVADLEAEIAALEGTMEQCQANLALPEVHRDPARLKATMELLESTQTQLATLYEHWEEAVELN